MWERLRASFRNSFPPRTMTVTIALSVGMICALTFQNCGSRASMLLTSVDPSVMGTASVIVNDKAQYTQTEDVALELLPPRGLSAPLEMYVTNTPGCAGGGTWQPYERKLPWRLAQNNQIAVVYAKFRPALGDRSIESFCAEGGIIHDNTPPELAMPMKPPATSSDKQAAFTLAALDRLSGLQSMECALEGEEFKPCSENFTKNVNIGQHKFLLRAKDRAGNIAPAVAYTWAVLSGPPSVAFTKKPPSFTNQVKSEFAFSFTDPDPTATLQRFECALDSSPFETCQAIQDRNVPEGLHTLRVKGLSTKNLWSPEVSTTWTIDLTPPVIDFPNPIRTSYSQGNPISFSYAVSDAVSGVDSASTQYGSEPANTKATFSGLISKTASETSGSFTVTAKDKAGNSATVTKTWSVTPQDEMTLVPGVDTPPLKVLFMVDDSNSMSQSQKNLADGIKPMLASLNGVRAAGRLNSVFATDRVGWYRTTYLDGRPLPLNVARTLTNYRETYSSGAELGSEMWSCTWIAGKCYVTMSNTAASLIEIGATDANREGKISTWANLITNVGIKGASENRGLDGLVQNLVDKDPNAKKVFEDGDKALIVLVTDADDNDSKGIYSFQQNLVEVASVTTAGYRRSSTRYDADAWYLQIEVKYNVTRDAIVESVAPQTYGWPLVGEVFAIPSSGWIDPSMDGAECPSTDKISFKPPTALPVSDLQFTKCKLKLVRAGAFCGYRDGAYDAVWPESFASIPGTYFPFPKPENFGFRVMTAEAGLEKNVGLLSKNAQCKRTEYDKVDQKPVTYQEIKRSPATTLYSFAEDIKTRYGADPAKDKTVIQKGIRDLLNQRFGENGYRFTAIVNDGTCPLGAGQSVGTSFIQLANLLGSKGQVIPICRPELYGAALKQTGLDLSVKVKSQLLIDRPNKGIRSAWIVKTNGALVALASDQYTFEKNVLTVKDGLLGIGELVKVKLIVE